MPETIADRVHPDELDVTETEPDLCTEIYVLVEVVQDVFEFGDPPEERSERRLLADYPEGEGACLTAPDQSYRLWEGIPDSRLCIVPGCAHNVHLERPELFSSIVLDFLTAG